VEKWQLIALALALVVGLLAALFANTWQPPADPNFPAATKDGDGRK
jgi:hypothetical protein